MDQKEDKAILSKLTDLFSRKSQKPQKERYETGDLPPGTWIEQLSSIQRAGYSLRIDNREAVEIVINGVIEKLRTIQSDVLDHPRFADIDCSIKLLDVASQAENPSAVTWSCIMLHMAVAILCMSSLERELTNSKQIEADWSELFELMERTILCQLEAGCKKMDLDIKKKVCDELNERIVKWRAELDKMRATPEFLALSEEIRRSGLATSPRLSPAAQQLRDELTEFHHLRAQKVETEMSVSSAGTALQIAENSARAAEDHLRTTIKRLNRTLPRVVETTIKQLDADLYQVIWPVRLSWTRFGEPDEYTMGIITDHPAEIHQSALVELERLERLEREAYIRQRNDMINKEQSSHTKECMNTWVCSGCGQHDITGKFCPNCGKRRDQ